MARASAIARNFRSTALMTCCCGLQVFVQAAHIPCDECWPHHDDGHDSRLKCLEYNLTHTAKGRTLCPGSTCWCACFHVSSHMLSRETLRTACTAWHACGWRCKVTDCVGQGLLT
ncbi:hypothetical protein COO60DRAFT_387175 [Scenedesmus sp. NREL 46B-D3]|nr:hypothetical protein COO60DRAFT_387175 [Scenedesmus sp. NREL 46B-D3]